MKSNSAIVLADSAYFFLQDARYITWASGDAVEVGMYGDEPICVYALDESRLTERIRDAKFDSGRVGSFVLPLELYTTADIGEEHGKPAPVFFLLIDAHKDVKLCKANDIPVFREKLIAAGFVGARVDGDFVLGKRSRFKCALGNLAKRFRNKLFQIHSNPKAADFSE